MSDEKRDLTRKRLVNMMREDSYHKRDLRDPEFTVDELVRASRRPDGKRYSRVDMLRKLLQCGIGRARFRNGRWEKVVKFSELAALADEFNWI